MSVYDFLASVLYWISRGFCSDFVHAIISRNLISDYTCVTRSRVIVLMTLRSP